jgi:chromosome segregation ATPase
LSEILKQTQLKLQENQQLRMVAEHNCEDLSRELLGSKDKIDCLQNQMNALQRDLEALQVRIISYTLSLYLAYQYSLTYASTNAFYPQDNKTETCLRIEELEKRNGELRNECERMKNAICRSEEQLTCAQKRLEEKQHEIVQLTAMLEQVSTRSLCNPRIFH